MPIYICLGMVLIKEIEIKIKCRVRNTCSFLFDIILWTTSAKNAESVFPHFNIIKIQKKPFIGRI